MSSQLLVTSVSEPVASAASARGARLLSLDLFRGITIAAMILVNDPGDELSAYWPLRHAQWNGWTPTDLIFPFFLFIVGVAMAFSLPARLDRGASPREVVGHVLWRGAVLFAIGLFLNGFPNHYQLDHWRVYGVLQRIAVCYVLVAVLELRAGWRAQLAVASAALVGYWVLMRFVPVPGFGIPAHDVPLLDPDRNLAAWLDRKLLAGHLYEVTRDPEGVLSTIPAVATCLVGLLAGKWLGTVRTSKSKALGLAFSGISLAVLGKVANLWFPINKKLWTSSYVLFTAGLALISLAILYWIVDSRQHRGWWTRLVLVFGKHAIAAFVFAEVVAHLLDGVHLGRFSLEERIYAKFFLPLATPAMASLLYALVFVLLSWCAMALLYRRRIFLKI
jgi:predicted acyltransferase